MPEIVARYRHYLPTLVLFLYLAAIAAACGYHNPNLLPESASGPVFKLYAPYWENPTSEVGLDNEIMNAISDRLIQAKRIQLVNSAGEADYLLEGKILSVSYPGLAYDITDTARTLKAVLNVSYTIKAQADGRIVWRENNLRLERPYNIGATPAQTDQNKREALELAAQDLSEQVYIRTFRALSRSQRRK